jgi:molybdopterin synthase catalytic subunit
VAVRVQTGDFDVGAEIAQLRAGDTGVGAVAAFVGTVRDVNDASQVSGLTLEHYAGMTEAALEAIVDEACEFVMDYLKTRAPFWKKERRPDGERWVDARASDDEAAQRW